MILEVPIEQFIAPPIFLDEEPPEEDDFSPAEQQEKNVDYQNRQQGSGFKQGLLISICDKNINFSKRHPGNLTIDLDRREEPSSAHAPCQEIDELDVLGRVPPQ